MIDGIRPNLDVSDIRFYVRLSARFISNTHNTRTLFVPSEYDRWEGSITAVCTWDDSIC